MTQSDLETVRTFFASLMAAASESTDPRLARIFELVPLEAFMCSGSDVVLQLAVFPAVSVRPGSVHELFLPDFPALDHGLERRSAATHFALMSALVIVVMQPFIRIGLKRIKAVMEFFGNAI